MRIGIFTHNYPKNNDDRKNAGVFVKDFATELSKNHEVYIYEPKISDKLGNWSLFSLWSVYKFMKLILIGSRGSIVFARKNKLNYCLAVWAIPSGIFVMVIKKFLNIPYAVWCLGSDINFYARIPILRQVIKSVLKNADRVFANSLFLKDKVEKLTGRKCVFLPAVTEFVRDGNVDLSRNNKIPTFLYVGRLEKVKGPDLLIKACRAVRIAGVNFSLYVLGGGGMLDKLKKMVRKYSLTPNIYFEGWADKKEIAGFMKKADILVIPSRNESLPLVLIEAARFNLPSIVSRVGDCSEVVKKYNIGLSFRKGDISELARLMIRFAQNRNFHVDNQGFEKMLEKYSLGESVITFEHEILNK